MAYRGNALHSIVYSGSYDQHTSDEGLNPGPCVCAFIQFTELNHRWGLGAYWETMAFSTILIFAAD